MGFFIGFMPDVIFQYRWCKYVYSTKQLLNFFAD